MNNIKLFFNSRNKIWWSKYNILQYLYENTGGKKKKAMLFNCLVEEPTIVDEQTMQDNGSDFSSIGTLCFKKTMRNLGLLHNAGLINLSSHGSGNSLGKSYLCCDFELTEKGMKFLGNKSYVFTFSIFNKITIV